MYIPRRKRGIQNITVEIHDEILKILVDLTKILGPTATEAAQRRKDEKSEADPMAVMIGTTDGVKSLVDPEHPGTYRPERILVNVTKDIPAPLPETLDRLIRVMHHPNLDAWTASNPDNLKRLLGAQKDNLEGYGTLMTRILKEMEEI